MSRCHCLLLRKDLDGLLDVPHWPKDIRLGILRPEQLEAVHALLVEGYRDSDIAVDDFPHWRERFTRDAEFDPTLCLIATDPHGLAGVAQCWTSAYIKDLVVHPRRRGEGLGQALLRHAFQVFASRGEAFVDLKVMENNLPARRLYDDAGMRFIQRYEVGPAQA
ncbi:GNAT family N-acetyltransferase [Pseudomonas asplenii]|uniref:Acetyltransferase n=1 Tax=Pseudomonas asplenii TaxID=53407 RepID=A0A0M9GJU1_9PSED|nr:MULTISPECIES: GNAT family N-acetyltransferase [Pseudomonas]KPA93034.1 acetyltransferase [Pseudomonas fuscovaginae]KPA95670.1 acetyltransferase [Pseudomonas fuscovaginae]